jgi:hypothetical protein
MQRRRWRNWTTIGRLQAHYHKFRKKEEPWENSDGITKGMMAAKEKYYHAALELKPDYADAAADRQSAIEAKAAQGK